VEQSVKSNFTYSSSNSSSNTSPSLLQAQGTGIRPALHAVWWGSHHTSHSPPLPPAGSRSRPTPKTCRPADSGRPAKKARAHAARRIAHTASERLDSPAARLATRRVKLLQSLCELATGRLDVSGEFLYHCETDQSIFVTISSCV
jgi:hypothetical protein